MYEQQHTVTASNLDFYQGSGDGSCIASYYPLSNNNSHARFVTSMSGNSFWSAFGTGGYPDEPSILEELGIDLFQIRDKAFVALNPLKPMDKNLVDNPDLVGSLLFCFAFGTFLMLSGKSHFEYIYGVGVFGCLSVYLILNLMSENGINGHCTVSVLGYCLLPMVILSSTSLLFQLTGLIGMLASALSICWCTYSSSQMFITVLSMEQQIWLVAYPVGLFYATFALMTIF